MKNIVVFASGGGTNLQALIDAVKDGRINAKISLVLSSKKDAGSLERARAAGIPCETACPKDFAPEKYDEHLASLCRSRQADLICLAGFMLKLGPKMLADYRNRIINIHPALLPAFGGKGCYGMKVHEAVIAAGVKLSGATAHFVDENYDRGPIILQQAVPVLEGDTAAALAARVLSAEHSVYICAAALFCAGRLGIENGKVKLSGPLPETGRVRRALISVSDKSGAAEFAKGLAAQGVEIVSTSGTFKLLKESGVPVRALETLTGFPEMLDGRVKTLHPAVHGGILYRRDDPQHADAVFRFGIEPIDLVAVNLYPFEETAKKAASWSEELIENIDIGGVALLRAAAKNYGSVAVLTSPADYGPVLESMRANGGAVSAELKKELAVRAFARTAAYDGAISGALSSPEPGRFPSKLEIVLDKVQQLRYGENPHQPCALYSRKGGLPFAQLQGKELSFNNILDAYGTWQTVQEFAKPAAVIFKHITPCGLGTGADIAEAFERAWSTDPLSAFGGIIAVNRRLDGRIAEFLAKRFIEVICAPDYDARALEVFAKKKNLRLLKWGAFPEDSLVLRSVGDEVLVSGADNKLLGDKWEVPTAKKPSKEEEEALRFAWTAVKYVRSNAIVLADRDRTVGIGAGQMSRVDAVFMAGYKYGAFLKDNLKPAALVLASDAFFPFPDSLETAAKLGVTAVIQPGGSVKDPEVISAADKLGLSMVLTGMRHFRH
ncbi:MAG: bifunctional phosphoribosylaminoimidazolecarboxamide formyltransferase/inosine monophosphate cyclohydrolase [Elusimicrobia bacterium CG08_land_8_20_14_0_20_59_10]|nr:MAG: bifunctional phosphoribosylaminoimidazolecarboxamide formyltransferase/inosine monophosphate cyclohydrolase [Elusimicrobia bacterium CG08_land_8_20_14_0_20_59_10]